MNKKNGKFKIGDRVKLISKVYEDSLSNPVWGGKQGKRAGTVFYIGKGSLPICVEWYNGEPNDYNEKDLELMTREDEMAEIEELKEIIKECSKKLEKLEKNRKSKKYYLKLKGDDVAIGEGKIMLIIVDKNGNPVEDPHVLFITEEGTLKLEAFINPDIGLELDEDGCIVIQ